MGSFTEVVPAFDFRPDTPTEVLAAFGQWLEPGSEVDLPEFDSLFTAEQKQRLENVYWDALDVESFRKLPVIEQAFGWQFYFRGMGTVYFPGEPGVRLGRIEDIDRWALTARFHQKDVVEPLCWLIRPLGRFACPDASPDLPAFVGYLYFENDDHPILIWHRGRDNFEFEDLREDPEGG